MLADYQLTKKQFIKEKARDIKGLSKSFKAVFEKLVDYYKDNQGFSWVGTENLLEQARISKDTCNKAIARLEELKMITVDRFRGRKNPVYSDGRKIITNIYFINFNHENWLEPERKISSNLKQFKNQVEESQGCLKTRQHSCPEISQRSCLILGHKIEVKYNLKYKSSSHLDNTNLVRNLEAKIRSEVREEFHQLLEAKERELKNKDLLIEAQGEELRVVKSKLIKFETQREEKKEEDYLKLLIPIAKAIKLNTINEKTLTMLYNTYQEVLGSHKLTPHIVDMILENIDPKAEIKHPFSVYRAILVKLNGGVDPTKAKVRAEEKEKEISLTEIPVEIKARFYKVLEKARALEGFEAFWLKNSKVQLLGMKREALVTSSSVRSEDLSAISSTFNEYWQEFLGQVPPQFIMLSDPEAQEDYLEIESLREQINSIPDPISDDLELFETRRLGSDRIKSILKGLVGRMNFSSDHSIAV